MVCNTTMWHEYECLKLQPMFVCTSRRAKKGSMKPKPTETVGHKGVVYLLSIYICSIHFLPSIAYRDASFSTALHSSIMLSRRPSRTAHPFDALPYAEAHNWGMVMYTVKHNRNSVNMCPTVRLLMYVLLSLCSLFPSLLTDPLQSQKVYIDL